LLFGCNNQLTVNLPPPAVFGTIAFQHVRVITVSGNEVLYDYTVLVNGSRIKKMGPSNSIIIPKDAFLIEGTGLTLMPGLTDMHAHYEEEEKGPLFVVNGITSVRNTWGSKDQFTFDSKAKAGDLVGPNVYTTGPLTDGPNPIHRRSVVIDSPESAAAAIDAQFSEGFKGIKLHEMLTKDLYKAAVGAAKANGMRISSHTPTAMQVEDLLELKINSIEHLDGYGEALSRGEFDSSVFRPNELWRESWQHVNEDALEPLAQQTAAANVWNVPTLTMYIDVYKYESEADNFFARSEINYVPPGIIKFWRGALKRTEPSLSHKLETALHGESARLKFMKALYDAGAPLLIGTDTPNPFIVPGYAIHDELKHFSDAGIPNDAIIRMATSEAARFLEIEGEFGVVATGARADLILIDGDPLLDLSVLREPIGVMVNGHWRTRAELIEVLEYNASKFKITADD
ncbi:MAG: hypothetical protein ACI9XC_002071, partial [Gammaproteobacteria bacterium]